MYRSRTAVYSAISLGPRVSAAESNTGHGWPQVSFLSGDAQSAKALQYRFAMVPGQRNEPFTVSPKILSMHFPASTPALKPMIRVDMVFRLSRYSIS